MEDSNIMRKVYLKLPNPARLHDAWFSAFFAASGALFVNVLTGLQNNLFSWVTVILSCGTFYSFARLERLRAGAAKEVEVGENNPFCRIKGESLLLFGVGLLLSAGVVWGILDTNQNQNMRMSEIENNTKGIKDLMPQLSVEIANFRGSLKQQADLLELCQDKLMTVEKLEVKESGYLSQILSEQTIISEEISKQQRALKIIHDNMGIIYKQNSTRK